MGSIEICRGCFATADLTNKMAGLFIVQKKWLSELAEHRFDVPVAVHYLFHGGVTH